MIWIFKLSRPRNNLLILFVTLVLINLFIIYEYLLPHRLTTLEEEESLRNLVLDGFDDGYSSTTVSHRNSSRILLVSSLFMLSKSKHSDGEYHSWLQHFLGHITTEVYFYTSPDLAPTVRSARGEGLLITIDTNYKTAFDVPPLKDQEMWYNEMHGLDRERSYHSPELYSVWNAKPFFVDNAIQVMASKGKTYDYVFWNDGGSFREINVYKDWPDPDRLDEIWQEGSKLSGTKAEDLLFYPIVQHPPYGARHWKEDMGPIDADFSEGKQISLRAFPSPLKLFLPGSFFGGSPSTMAWWARTFYAYHDYYTSKHLFVGKDQTVFNALLVLFNERIITVWVNDPKAPAANIGHGFQPLKNFYRKNFLGSCGNEWFYYQFWLSDRQTRDEMRKIWLEPQGARKTCRFTRVLALDALLKRTFGEEWKAPVPTLATPVRSWQH
jgi:hypothetical protein